MKSSFFFALLTLSLISCAAHHGLEPLGRGQVNGNLSVGGPIVAAFGSHIPVPYLTAGATYGLDDRSNVSGNFHILSLAYQIAGLDLGYSYFFTTQDGILPTFGINPQIMLLASLKKDVSNRFRLYPMLTPTAAWRLGNGSIYTGFDWTLPLTTQDYDDEAPATLISPFWGYRWMLKSNLFLFTEIKWQGANVRSDQLAVDYWPIGEHGAVSTLISIERGF